MASHRILIADDDVDALRLVGVMLEKEGYEIVAASHGQQAIQKAIETEPALIILDVMMPQVDGFEVAAALRRHPATESIPILMFTAKATVNDKIAGFQAGADDYLTKPVHPRELFSRVEALLQRQSRSSEDQERGRIIGFLSSKGGVGTSTLALNAAIELCRMHEEARSALIELQEGSGTIALQLGIGGAWDGSRGLPILIDKPLSYLNRERLREHMVRHSSGLYGLLASTKPAGLMPQITRGHVRTILRYLNTEFDYLLLDLPSRMDEAYREALQLCSMILMTVEPNRIGIELAQGVLNSLDAVGIGSHKVRLVLIHRVPISGNVSRNTVEQALQREMVASIPPAPDLAYESAKNGKPMVEIEPHGLVAQQVRRVVQAILDA